MSLKNRLIIGRQPVIEAINNATTIEKILVQSSANGDAINTIRSLAREHQIPIQFVPQEKLNSFTTINHQGVLAIASLINYLSIEELLAEVVEQNYTPLFVMLDGVTDVRNIGAIARSALCCGAQAIIIPDKGVGALNEDAIKSSAGALEQLRICRVNSLMKTVDELRANGIMVFGSEMTATTSVTNLQLKQPACIIMGNENKGIYPPLLKICNEKFNIPMAGKFESFNVSVAAGIILFEALKQRMN